MKKILINAISIKEGGGVVVLTKLLDEMLLQEKNIHWFVIIDDTIRHKITMDARVTPLTFSWTKKSVLHLIFWHEFYLPFLARKLHVDFVFSQTNILPIQKFHCQSLLLLQHAGYFSTDFISLHMNYNKSLMRKLLWKMRRISVFLALKKSCFITVQTTALADSIVNQVKINRNKLVVISHGSGIASGKISPKTFPGQKTWRIGYITKYGVQKNFSVLFKAMSELKKEKKNFKLILTLNENHLPFRHVKNLIELYEISDYIENHGEIEPPEIQALYQTLDLFVFPSLCESFGFTLVEAMYYRLPVIAASTPSNRELLGEHGIFFKPHDHGELIKKILTIMTSENGYFKASSYSYERSKSYSWTIAANNFINFFKQAGI